MLKLTTTVAVALLITTSCMIFLIHEPTSLQARLMDYAKCYEFVIVLTFWLPSSTCGLVSKGALSTGGLGICDENVTLKIVQ